MNKHTEEVSNKLKLIRQNLSENNAQGLRLRGTDWFAWVTGGASNTVLLTAETGIAEVLVTREDAWVLTDEIEAQRLIDEELPTNFKLQVNPWADTLSRENFVRDATSSGIIVSDRPNDRPNNPKVEIELPPSLYRHKKIMIPSELERYREVGRKASEAMTEVLKAAKPTWTEYQLAGAGAKALWARGLHPALTLVAGERRLPLYRHATPTTEKIGNQAMMVFCARGYGLYANLTRFVCFEVDKQSNKMQSNETQSNETQSNETQSNETQNFASLHSCVREIEAHALNLCKPGIPLNAVYESLAQAYERHGFNHAIREHHQGGTTGYLAREIIANPTTDDTLSENMAVAWNPSLAGAKIEDTFVILGDGNLENLTFDANFPHIEVEGRLRPVPLEN